MKRMISGLLSLMMLSMMGAACLPAQAAESDYAETTATTAPSSDVLQMSLNFSTIDRMLGTPLYLDGITACVFSQKNGYILAGESITNEKYFKLDTFEVDHADRPGTYNIYVAYNDQSVDLYTILYVNMYAETEPVETDVTTFGPVGTVWTETTIHEDTAPLDTTFTTTADPYGDATDYPEDTTFDAVGTMTTAVTTKRTYRTTLPTTETSQAFNPTGTVMTTATPAPVWTGGTVQTTIDPTPDTEISVETTAETTADPSDTMTTAATTKHTYRTTLPTKETTTGTRFDPVGTVMTTATSAPVWTGGTVQTTIDPTPDTELPADTTADTTSDAVGTATTGESTKHTYRTTLATTGTHMTTTTKRFDPVGTVVTSTTKATEPAATGTNTTADAAGTEIAPETTKPDTESGASRAGDANGDGEVNILDVIKLNRNLLCGEVLDAQAIRNADVDGDGMPTFADALMILKYTIRLITSF